MGCSQISPTGDYRRTLNFSWFFEGLGSSLAEEWDYERSQSSSSAKPSTTGLPDRCRRSAV